MKVHLLCVYLSLTLLVPISLSTGIGQQASGPFIAEMSWSPDSSHILFSVYQNGGASIHIMKADGSQRTQLTTASSEDLWGSFSPDGRRIVFQSKRNEQQEDLYVMDADGSHVTRLTSDPGGDLTPSWSRDGSRIAFSSSRDGGLHIYVIKADGSNPLRLTKLTKETIKYYNPVWSPNGKKLAFYSDKGDRKDQIQIINADGSGQTMLTGNVGNNIFPSWSADGKEIIFSSDRDGVEHAIYQVNLDGSNLKRIAPQVTGFVIRWSPDGKKIGFVSGRYPVSDIYVMNPGGSGVTKLTR